MAKRPAKKKTAKKSRGATKATQRAGKVVRAARAPAKPRTKKRAVAKARLQPSKSKNASAKRVAPKRAKRVASVASKKAVRATKRPTKASTSSPKAAQGRGGTSPVVLASFEQIQHFSAPPERIYGAWLDGIEHTAFTGGRAQVEARVGGAFSAWNGYIRGTQVELTPGERIVQSWRASDFPPGYPDSLLELHLVPENGGTRLHLRHIGVPAANAPLYEQGWHDHYWQPLRAWLATHAVPLD